ncbi:MAG: hypothetical protein ACFFDT_06395 [Candidatus Hodarchaeota archaeon]
MKYKSIILIIALFLSGLFSVTSTSVNVFFLTENTSTEKQLIDTVKKSVRLNIVDKPIRVAVYYEANTSVPEYSNAIGLTNDFSEVVSLLEDAGYDVSLIYSVNILNHELNTLNYDVFVMINNLPKENIAHLVQEFWLAGGGILSFNSAISYLFYYGLLVPELEGSEGYPFYWNYLSAENMNVSSRHPITQDYDIDDTVSERPENWVTYSVPVWDNFNSIEKGAINLLNNFTEYNFGYALAVDSTYRGGRVVHLPGDGSSIPSDFESIIVNAVDWLVPKPKASIAYDLSHQPRLGIDPWDAEFATVYNTENSFGQLRNLFVNHSYTVDKFYPSASGNFTAERLAAYDMMVIIWPDLNFTETEKTVVEDWISKGGSLALFGDRSELMGPNRGDLALNSLLSNFGMQLSGDNVLDFVSATPADEHLTLEGCSSLSISYRNYITITDAAVTPIWDYSGIPVVAAQAYGQGRVILFSDMNILDNGRLKGAHNARFAVNVANWLSATTAEILVYTSANVGVNHYRTPAVNALNELGLNFYLTTSAAYVNSTLISNKWSLVIIDEANHDVKGAYAEISKYIDTGGRIIMSSWAMNYYPDNPLWARFGVAYSEQWDNDKPAYIWDPTHPIFNIPIDYGALIVQGSGLYSDDGDKIHVFDNATALAGFSTSESENNSGIVLRNDGQTLFNSYIISGLLNDFDDSTYMDAVELWLNEIGYMMRPSINDPTDITYEEDSTDHNITWSPTSWSPYEYTVDINGTVAENESWNGSDIVFDADGLDPGIHAVRITVSDTLGFSVSDIVQVNVTEKPDLPFELDQTTILIVGGVLSLILIFIILRKVRGKKK